MAKSPPPVPEPELDGPRFEIFTLLEPKDVERVGGIPPQAVVGLVDPGVFSGGAPR